MARKQPSQRTTPNPDYADPEGFGVDARPDQGIRPTVYQVDVLPYRGQEYHGVDPNLAGPPPELNKDVFQQTMTVPFPEDDHSDPPMRAVPVRIVTEDDDWEMVVGRAFQYVVGPNNNAPVTVLNHAKDRKLAIIINNGTVALWVSHERNPHIVNSIAVPASGQIVINAANAFYAISSDGSPQPLSVYVEVTVRTRREQKS